MSVLIAFATGGRPRTSYVMQAALELALPEPVRKSVGIEIHAVRWKKDTTTAFAHKDVLGAYPAKAYDMVLSDYHEKHGEYPEYFFTLDDDCIAGRDTYARMMVILDAHPDIGLIGAWNDQSERGRGAVGLVQHKMGEDLLQMDDDGEPFCVGGAMHAIPRRTIEAVVAKSSDGLLYPQVIRREDEGLTARVRDLGLHAVLALTIPIALLPDDEIDPNYRNWILAQHGVAVNGAR